MGRGVSPGKKDELADRKKSFISKISPGTEKKPAGRKSLTRRRRTQQTVGGGRRNPLYWKKGGDSQIQASKVHRQVSREEKMAFRTFFRKMHGCAGERGVVEKRRKRGGGVSWEGKKETRTK